MPLDDSARLTTRRYRAAGAICAADEAGADMRPATGARDSIAITDEPSS